MKKALFILLVGCSTLSLCAQYNSALGVKHNHYKGAINYKIFLSDSSNAVLDLEFGFQRYGVEFIGLYNLQYPFSGVEHLYWYCGIGVNAGLWDGPVRDISVGVDGQVGLEFVPLEIPIIFSLDYTPNFSLQNSYSKEYNSGSWGAGFWFKNWTSGMRYRF
jgi:hypothetical protein